jgi:transposase-like protein
MQDKIQAVTENKTNRRLTSKEIRAQHIEKWKESGLTMSEYCRQNKLSLSSFSSWRQSAIKAKSSFKPIALSSSASTLTNQNIVEIMVDQRIKLRLLNVIDGSFAANIVRSLLNAINN